MSTATQTTVTVQFDPNSTSLQSDIVGPATPNKAGVMTAAQAAALAALLPMTGEIVKENFNTWVDAVNGNDANDGRTEATAFKTITKAFADQPVAWFKDNLLFVKPGSYDLDEGSQIFDASFGGFVGDQGSPLAIIAVEPQEFLAEVAATSATAYSVTVLGAGWAVNAFKGLTFWSLTGTGANQRATIRSNTADTLFLQRELTTPPSVGTTFKIIGPSNATELLGSNAAVVFPFITGGLGMRDMQMRFTGNGALSISDGTRWQAMSGCKIVLGNRNMNIRRGATVICGTTFSGQWDNSDQGIPLFPGTWDCSLWITGTGGGNNINLDESSAVAGGMMCDGVQINPGRNSSFRPTSLFATTTTITALEGATVNFQSTANVPTVLNGQKAASATTGIVNLANNARAIFAGPASISNSGGHGVLVDKMSYMEILGDLSGTANVGVGVKLDRGAQLDLLAGVLPTITGGGGELKVGSIAAQLWATLNPAASFVDPTLLCRATSR